ncbi:MAG TPA: four helix bundle protein, partial [Longimicrobium sp.]|nr:four helix bundle protein [Longimicrobium sp.]
ADSHRDLVVWHKAMDLAVQVYRLTTRFPRDEAYRLTAQVTRAAASIPANIAEGNARSSRRDCANFLAIAKGSLNETETFLLLALRLGYLREPELAPDPRVDHRSGQDAYLTPRPPHPHPPAPRMMGFAGYSLFPIPYSLL